MKANYPEFYGGPYRQVLLYLILALEVCYIFVPILPENQANLVENSTE